MSRTGIAGETVLSAGEKGHPKDAGPAWEAPKRSGKDGPAAEGPVKDAGAAGEDAEAVGEARDPPRRAPEPLSRGGNAP
jgi:hypothetical protein